MSASEEPLKDAPPPAAWWKSFNRSMVLAELEVATGAGISVDDPRPDTLIAQAEALGMLPAELRMFILDVPPPADFSAETLTEWARRYGVDRSAAFAETRTADEALRTKAEALRAKAEGGD